MVKLKQQLLNINYEILTNMSQTSYAYATEKNMNKQKQFQLKYAMWHSKSEYPFCSPTYIHLILN